MKVKDKLSKLLSADALKAMVDRSDKIIDLITKAGIAYVGYRAWNHWSGALTSLIALKLATSNNVAAGAAGVGVLSTLGIQSAFTTLPPATQSWIMDLTLPWWLQGAKP